MDRHLANFLLLTVLGGCSDQFAGAPAALEKAEVMVASVTESAGFYFAEGWWNWNGLPAEGESGAVIHATETPALTAPSRRTRGWVRGGMTFTGDEYSFLFVLSAQRGAQSLMNPTNYGTEWSGCFTESRCVNYRGTSRAIHYPDYLPRCEIAVSAGGEARARNKTPFGIKIWLIKIIPGWSHQQYETVTSPLPSITINASGWCDEAPTNEDLACDDDQTPQIEYCMDPEDPSNPVSPGFETTEAILLTRPEAVAPYSGLTAWGCIKVWKITERRGGEIVRQYYDGCAEWGVFELE